MIAGIRWRPAPLRPLPPNMPMSQIATNHVAIEASERGGAADRDGLAVGAIGSEEAGGDRGEDEDRLQTLAEDQDRAVEHRLVRLRWLAGSVGSGCSRANAEPKITAAGSSGLGRASLRWIGLRHA